MSLDLTLLRIVKRREDFDKLAKSIPDQVLDERTRVILKDFGKFFREHDDVAQISFEPFWFWFKTFAHPRLSEEGKATYEQLLKPIDEDVTPGLRDGIMARLVAAETANNLLKMVDRYMDGEEIDLGASLKAEVEAFDMKTDRKVKQPWVRANIDELLEDDINDAGFHWRLKCLNESLRPARAGDFILVAARPDVGKTTFFTDQLTHFAAQVDALYPGENRSILWFNNEGLGKRIVTRLYQSALDAGIDDLIKRQKAGTIKQDYLDATGGREDIIKVMDIHDFWNHEVEDIMREHNPAIVVFDMVDNIKFGGAANNNGQRTDQLLEAMYQWARVMGVKHDCVVLATSQVSADGENMQYPLLGMLKDSKTGKQGAADAIITIGYQSDYPDARFMGTTKNKLAREGAPKSPRSEVHFDGSHGRYRSISEIKDPEQ